MTGNLETKSGGSSDEAPSGQLFAMPVLIINLAAEMVYIMEQRLIVQKVKPANAQTVIDDLVRTLCERKIIKRLFTPQRIQSKESIRKSFTALAHCSLVKLNDSSMEKLFQLMTSVFKHQVMSCALPWDIIQITLNHIEALRSLVSTPKIRALLDSCASQVRCLYQDMPISSLIALRRHVCLYLQDHKTKVTLLLLSDAQADDGSIRIPNGGTYHLDAFPVGTIRQYKGGSEHSRIDLEPVTRSAWSPGDSPGAAGLGRSIYREVGAMKVLQLQLDTTQQQVSCISLGGEIVAEVGLKQACSLVEFRQNVSEKLQLSPEVELKLVSPSGQELRQFDSQDLYELLLDDQESAVNIDIDSSDFSSTPGIQMRPSLRNLNISIEWNTTKKDDEPGVAKFSEVIYATHQYDTGGSRPKCCDQSAWEIIPCCKPRTQPNRTIDLDLPSHTDAPVCADLPVHAVASVHEEEAPAERTKWRF